jgi:hypothetical protein
MPVCTKCIFDKPIEEFHRNTSKASGHQSQCKKCVGEYCKVYQAQPENRAKARSNKRKSLYGISDTEYLALLEDQDFSCAACGVEFVVDGDGYPIDKFVHLDHCHDTGTIRGILCNGCNLALGHLKDDPVRVMALLEYITGAYVSS